MWGTMPVVIQQAQGLNGQGGATRPFMVGMLLLLLFLSTQTDWNPTARRQRMEVRAGMARNPAATQDSIRDKLLFDMLTSNEKLEKENRALRYRILLLNKTMRGCGGCNHTDLPFQPFLDEEVLPLPCDKERASSEIRIDLDGMLGVQREGEEKPEEEAELAAERARGRAGERGYLSRSRLSHMRDRMAPRE